MAGYDISAAAVVRLSRPSDAAIDLVDRTVHGFGHATCSLRAPPNGTLHFEPLQTVAAVPVLVLGDPFPGTDESFVVEFTPSSALAGPGAGNEGSISTVTILDGDLLPPPARLEIEASADVRLDEGSSLQRGLVLSDGDDNAAAGRDYVIDYGDGTVDSGHIDALTVGLVAHLRRRPGQPSGPRHGDRRFRRNRHGQLHRHRQQRDPRPDRQRRESCVAWTALRTDAGLIGRQILGVDTLVAMIVVSWATATPPQPTAWVN